MEWTPNQKGAIAEAQVAAAATVLGIPVLKPVFEDRRYDLVFETPDGLIRVQCKWARRRRNIIDVNARTFRLVTGGSWERTTCSADEVDAIAIYCPDVGRCYLIPLAEVPPSGCMYLRLAPAKNNQLKGLHSAAEYELTPGAIAQLGERLRGTQEVAGSSPASSTPEEPRISRLFS
jgi:hypothetical protein